MARAIWTGVITFGMVTVPVSLFTATRDHAVHFHQLQRDTADRVRNRRVNERTGKEVPSDDIVKGYQVREGEYVVVEPGELDEIAPGRSKSLDISAFVDADAITPVYLARTYYVAPRGETYARVYALLRAALERSRRAGVATFVMRGRQYLTALRAENDLLVLHTLHWADEVRDPSEELPELPGRAPGGKELDTAVQLVEALSAEWEPEQYRDDYEEKVRDLVRAKAEGREVELAEEPPEATNVVDLMSALQDSIEQAGGRGSARRRGSSGGRGAKRTEGRSGGGRAKGTGGAAKKKSRGTDLERMSREELYRRAADRGVRGRSKMNRDELLEALSAPAQSA